MRFVVVGTGRSGTGYAARMLSACGIPTGHEEVYGWGRDTGRHLAGDSSWLAATDARADGVPYVFHQTRHPEATLRSMLGGEMFGAARRSKWFRFRASHIPMSGDDVIDAMAIFVGWTRLCEQARPDLTWRVEDGVPVDKIADLVGVEAHPPTEPVPTDVNAHRRADGFTLNDLPRGPLRDRVMAIGQAHGYL